VNGRSSNAVTIRNTGSAAVAAWRLSFTLPDRQRLLRGWTGRWQQSGRSVQALGGALPPGSSVTTGFDAAYRDVTSLPAAFALNGTTCASVMSVRGQNTPTAPPPTRSIPKPAKAAPAPAQADDKAEGKGKDKGKGQGTSRDTARAKTDPRPMRSVVGVRCRCADYEAQRPRPLGVAVVPGLCRGEPDPVVLLGLVLSFALAAEAAIAGWTRAAGRPRWWPHRG
jgi:hypothetical protein